MSKLSQITVATLSALLFAGAASAQTTRAEVVAELAKAQASGELAALRAGSDGLGYLQPVSTRSVKTQAEVAADLQAARKSGELAALQAQQAGAPQPLDASKQVGGRSRAQVVAELQRARETGELEILQAEGGVGYYPIVRGLSNTPVVAGR